MPKNWDGERELEIGPPSREELEEQIRQKEQELLALKLKLKSLYPPDNQNPTSPAHALRQVPVASPSRNSPNLPPSERRGLPQVAGLQVHAEDSVTREDQEPEYEVLPPLAPLSGTGSSRSQSTSEPNTPQAVIRPVPSERASNVYEYKVKMEFDRTKRVVSASIKWTWEEFLFHMAKALDLEPDNFLGPDPALHLHYIDKEGDVLVVTNEDGYEEMTTQYTTSAPWRDLAPLRVVVLQGDVDPLTLVAIPPHAECPEPMPWKQGKLLGHGAFGSVYMAMKGDGTLIAVKRLDLAAAGQDVAESYTLESSLLQRLRHPNIVRYIASKIVSKTLAMIWMEYVPGGSVANLLQAFGAVSEDTVRNYTRQILQGLVYLHDNSVIHRDVKPGNILVSVDGQVKLSDFGASLNVASSVVRDSIKSGQTVKKKVLAGTPSYIAPEVLRAQSETGYTYNIDVWSLGITVKEMLTAEQPFNAVSNPFAVMFQVARMKTVPPLPENISPEGTSFLSQCLQPDPKSRPSSQELAKHPYVSVAEPQIFQGGSFLRRMKNIQSPEDYLVSAGPRGQIDAAVPSETPASEEDEFEDAVEAPVGGPGNPLANNLASMDRTGSPNQLLSTVLRPVEQIDPNQDLDPVLVADEEYARQLEAEERTRTSSGSFEGSWRGSASSGSLAKQLSEEEVLMAVQAESALATDGTDHSIIVSPQALADLKEMGGFSDEQARTALRMYDNDVQRAAAWLWDNSENPEPGSSSATVPMQRSAENGPGTDAGDVKSKKVGRLARFFRGGKDKKSQSISSDNLPEWANGGADGPQAAASGQHRLVVGSDAPPDRPVPPTPESRTEIGQRIKMPSLSSKTVSGMKGKTRSVSARRGSLESNMEWRFLHHQHWHLYDSTTAAQIEAAFQKGEKKIRIMINTDSSRGTEYDIILSGPEYESLTPANCMKQVNVVSGFTRQILRRTAGQFRIIEQETADRQAQTVEPGVVRTIKMPTENDELRSYLHSKVMMELEETIRLKSQIHSGGNVASMPQGFAGASLTSIPTSLVNSLEVPPASPVSIRRSMAAGLGSGNRESLVASVEKLEYAELIPAASVSPGGSHEGWNILLALDIGNVYNRSGEANPLCTLQTPEALGSMTMPKDSKAHSWTAFVRARDGHSLNQKISKVCFGLNPNNIEKDIIDIGAEPYEVTRWSFSPFDLTIQIWFYGKSDPVIVRHFLCLSVSGSWSNEKASTQDESFPLTQYVLVAPPGKALAC